MALRKRPIMGPLLKPLMARNTFVAILVLAFLVIILVVIKTAIERMNT
jgi:hypothetical protein